MIHRLKSITTGIPWQNRPNRSRWTWIPKAGSLRHELTGWWLYSSVLLVTNVEEILLVQHLKTPVAKHLDGALEVVRADR